MKNDSLLKNQSFRIILEFIILLLVIALIITLVLTGQINSGDKKAKNQAKTIYDNITEVMEEQSFRTIDKLLSLSFDDGDNNKLVASAYSGDKVIDFAMTVSSTSLVECIPTLLEKGFTSDLMLECLVLNTNEEISIGEDETIKELSYRVATLGLDILMYGTYLSKEGTYTSFYQRTYDSVNNIWNEDGISSSVSQNDNKTLFELYKLMLSN